ncbi:MAG: hypothetical protein ACTSRH_18880 [Promethearchaeota archaeon]
MLNSSDCLIEIENGKNVTRNSHLRSIDALNCINGTFILEHLILELNEVKKKLLSLGAKKITI